MEGSLSSDLILFLSQVLSCVKRTTQPVAKDLWDIGIENEKMGTNTAASIGQVLLQPLFFIRLEECQSSKRKSE